MANSSSEIDILGKIIEKAKNEKRKVNIYAHKFPDGDAVASSKTLEKVLRDNGIEAEYIVTSRRVNNRFASIIGETEQFNKKVSDEDISVILDTSTVDYAENNLFMNSKPENIFVIDHHKKDDKATCIEDELEISPENVLRNSESSSVCEIFSEELEKNGLLNSEYATNLMIGLWTDTAKFRYPKENTLKNLDKLLTKGADYEKIKETLNYKIPLKFEVGMAKALVHTNRIKIGNTYLNYLGIDNKTVGRLSYKYGLSYIQKKVFKMTNVENTGLSVMIVENNPNEYDCEFRSSEEIGNVNVFKVASELGGGGHHNASGCNIKTKKSLDKVSREVLAKTTDEGLPKLAFYEPREFSDADQELKKVLDDMERFNINLNSENLEKIQNLINQGANYQSDYDEKISFEQFLIRNSILTQIPDEQLEFKNVQFKLTPEFMSEMQDKFGASVEDVLQGIEIFKEIDIDYVSMVTPEGKGISIDKDGNIKKFESKNKDESIK